MTIALVVIGSWVAVSLVLGVILAKFIKAGSGDDE